METKIVHYDVKSFIFASFAYIYQGESAFVLRSDNNKLLETSIGTKIAFQAFNQVAQNRQLPDAGCDVLESITLVRNTEIIDWRVLGTMRDKWEWVYRQSVVLVGLTHGHQIASVLAWLCEWGEMETWNALLPDWLSN